MGRTAVAAAVATLAVALASGSPARATFPGGSGMLVAVRTDGARPGVYTLAADGSGATFLTAGRRPDWSPDGKRLAVERDSGIWVVDVANGAETRVGRGSDPAWSPDGGRLAVWDGDGVWILDLADGSRRLVARGGEPDWAADGRIAFVRGGDLYVIEPDGR